MTFAKMLFTLIYLFALLLGTVVTTLTLVLSIKKKTQLNQNIKNFSLGFLIYVLVEFLVYYCLANRTSGDILLAGIHVSNICYFIFTFCWIKLLIIISGNQKIIKERTFKISTIIYGIFAEGLAIFIAHYDYQTQYFHIHDGIPRDILSGMNLIFGVAILYLSIRYLLFAIKHMEKKRERIGTILFGGILFLYTLWNIYWDYNFARGMVIDSGENYTMDPLLLIYIAQSVLVIWFFLKKDPLEVGTSNLPTGGKTIEEVGLSINLTEREIQVMALVCQGCSNPEIGQKLYIAENTVKRHLNNIFRKAETKNRYELLSFVECRRKDGGMNYE